MLTLCLYQPYQPYQLGYFLKETVFGEAISLVALVGCHDNGN
jgi:hypothetical protein